MGIKGEERIQRRGPIATRRREGRAQPASMPLQNGGDKAEEKVECSQ